MGSPHQPITMEKHPQVTILLSVFLFSSTVHTLPLLILLAQSPSSPLLTTEGQNFILLGEYNEILDTAEGIEKNNMEQEKENNEESIILDIDDIVVPFELEDMVQI